MVKFRNILFDYSEENANNKMKKMCDISNRLFANHMSRLKSRMKE